MTPTHQILGQWVTIKWTGRRVRMALVSNPETFLLMSCTRFEGISGVILNLLNSDGQLVEVEATTENFSTWLTILSVNKAEPLSVFSPERVLSGLLRLMT